MKTSNAITKTTAKKAAKKATKKATKKKPTTKKAKATTAVNKRGKPSAPSPKRLIDEKIKGLGDWRGTMLSRVRGLIQEADPEVIEEWKWGTPVWSHDGILCTGETYKAVVKMTFAKGASLPDPSRLFNSSLEGNVRRAIDIRQEDRINEPALKALIRAAVALNTSAVTARPPKS